MILVVITSLDGQRELLEKHSMSTTISQLKAKWQEQHSVAIEDMILETEDHKDLEDSTRLEEITDSSAKALLMTMIEVVKLEFSLMCSDKPPVQLSIFPSIRPSDSIPKIREHFAIEDSRAIRFSSKIGPLDSTIPFQDQEVIDDCQISVEVELRVHVKSEWTSQEDIEPISCFTGDFVEPTLTDLFSGEFQLFYRDKLLKFSDRICDALEIALPDSEVNQTVEVRMSRKIFLIDAHGLREACVSPDTKIRDLGLSCSTEMLMCETTVMNSPEGRDNLAAVYGVTSVDLSCGDRHKTDASVQVTGEGSSKWLRSVATNTDSNLLDRTSMAQSPSHIQFDLYEADGQSKSWHIKCFPMETLPDLLDRLSKKSQISVDKFSNVFQFEFGKVENERPYYLVKSAKQSENEKKQALEKKDEKDEIDSKTEWTKVYANQYRVEEDETVLPQFLWQTNTFVAGLDDVFCPAGLTPNISIGLSCVFLELDDLETFSLIPISAEAIFKPQYVALMACLRLHDRRKKIPSKLMLISDGIGFTDFSSGETFEKYFDASLALRIPPNYVHVERCIILLRQNSRLAKWPISPSLTPNIAIREGMDFSIKNGMIDVNGNLPSVLSRRYIFPNRNPMLNVPKDSKPHKLVKEILEYIST